MLVLMLVLVLALVLVLVMEMKRKVLDTWDNDRGRACDVKGWEDERERSPPPPIQGRSLYKYTPPGPTQLKT